MDIANILEGITTIPAEELPVIRDKLAAWAWSLRYDKAGREAVLEFIAITEQEMKRRPSSPSAALANLFREF